MTNQYKPWEELGLTELEYFKKRYLEFSAECERLTKELHHATVDNSIGLSRAWESAESARTQLTQSLAREAVLREALLGCVEALKWYAGRTVSIKNGYIRLNYNGTADGPGMCFYENEEWILGDHATDALALWKAAVNP